MSDQFVAEIRMFPFNFAPVGWASCDGQLLSISQNTALFSLLGTNFGGNGTSNFGLPNVDGNCVVHVGQGAGLSPYVVGQTGGAATVTLFDSQNASHNHFVNVVTTDANSTSPPSNVFARGNFNNSGSAGPIDLYSGTTPGVTLAATEIGFAGGSQPHNNLMPYLTVNFCIALQGIYPARG
jgi:microcystin-dependent protein